jgi:hypothetical protein
VAVDALSGSYDGVGWQIQKGTRLVVDSGPEQETVVVTAVDPATAAFAAIFARAHPAGFLISNTVLGNPGPQPRFRPRENPAVVPYFSVID